MTHNDQALELIESAMRETPFCRCGATTDALGRTDGIWLECSSMAQSHGILRRLLTLDLAVVHTRRLIVDNSLIDVAA